ncbi:MAG: hypothetical protein HFACDABA_03163 [Anaerolineales bacterium]|nr:hypothetical protein [Anaerolineales bacterium]
MVERLKEEYNADVEWRPFYLRPDTPPEGAPLPEYILRARANGSDERLKQIAGSYGMEFVSTQRMYNTRLAHEATEFAREQGKGNEFHRIVFRKVYAEDGDPSAWEVLRACAEEAGLDADAMQREVESGKFTELVAAQVQDAYQIGVQGVPTYVINDRYAVVGAQPYEAFTRMIQRLKSDGSL